MNTRHTFSLLLLCVLLFASCAKKKETRTIITKVQPPKVSAETKALQDSENRKSLEWGGDYYDVTITCKADKQLPTVTDGDGNKYYDNVVTLKIDGPKGTLVKRTFRKSDFAPYIDTNYIKPSASILSGLDFGGVADGKAQFFATVGSPDAMDDEYMLVSVVVGKDGSVSMGRFQEDY